MISATVYYILAGALDALDYTKQSPKYPTASRAVGFLYIDGESSRCSRYFHGSSLVFREYRELFIYILATPVKGFLILSNV